MPRIEELNAPQLEDFAPEFIVARNAKACDALLNLLARHHADHAPLAAAEYFNRPSFVPDPDPEPAAPAPPEDAEDAKITAWVTRQRKLHPKLREWNNPQGRGPEMRAIQQKVCEVFNVTYQDLISARRHKGLIEPRQIAVYLARKLTTFSTPEIGRKFGGRDHSTILWSIQRAAEHMARDPRMAAKCAEIQSYFESAAE